MSDTEAVKSVYVSLVAQLDRADSLPAEFRKQQLSKYMADPQLSRVLKRIEELRTERLTSYGKTVAHVTSVDVNGKKAVLRDCQDASNAGLMNALTYKKVNRGLKEEGVTAHLVKGDDGQWRATKIISLGKGC